MSKKTVKKFVALLLAICLSVPAVHYSIIQETKAADSSVTGEVGDTDGDGIIDAKELVRIKKNASNSPEAKYDLDNDGNCGATDAQLMREFLVGTICSFYRPDTSSVNNDTAYYTVTDALDRQMRIAGTRNSQKAVGIRYFLHFGTEESNPLYSVSNVSSNNATAYTSDAAWTAAGGGAVGTKHWWGEPLFGYYYSTDAWVISRDVQMLTDAGIDFIAIDTSEAKINEAGLTVLLDILAKYAKQGFEVPKVTFTSTSNSAVSGALESYYSNEKYADLWYKSGNEIVKSIADLTMKTVHAAKSVGGTAMSESAFYGDTMNHQRSFNGSINVDEADASLQGYNFAREFEDAIASDTNIIFVESWNEWIAERKASDDNAKPIVLTENADMNNSSDIQPMKDGYGDDYYMQMIDYIKQFKGSKITNNKLNTATATEGVSIDINGEFSQWNKVSSHYLDYTGDIADRDSDGYEVAAPGEVKEDNKAAAITINQLNENAPMSFITKNAYAGGSTVFLRAYVPTGASWWAVCWTTDPSNTDLYKWTSGEAYGKSMLSTEGAWKDYSVTLPNDSNTYYIYVVGAKGEWPRPATGLEDMQLLIDNVEIKGADGKVTATETFNNGLANSIFSCGESIVSLVDGEEVKETPEEPTNTNQAAAITINDLKEESPMSFITKNAYAGGSTVSFRAYVPEGASWWAVCWTTDPSNTGLYEWTGSNPKGQSMTSTIGAWADYSVTLPSDSDTYYVYVVGAKGEWKDSSSNKLLLLIDNVEIKAAGGNVTATETFDNGLENSIFTCGNGVTLAEGDAEGATPEEPTEPTKTYTDKSGRNDIAKMKMTTDGTNLYCFVETVDAIQGFGSANCMSLFISTGNVGGCYNQYEYVVNRDSSKAADGKLVVEKYVGGAWVEVGRAPYRMVGNKLQLAIPLTTLNCDEAFSLEFKWADNYKEDDVYSFYTSGDAAPYGRVNYVFKATASVVAINIDLLNEGSPMNFITKNAYAGGSTVSFKGYVPEEVGWWAVCWTTDPSDTGLYKWTGSNPQGQSMTSKIGEWEEYNVTLPDDENKYYIYIVGAKGEWNGKQLLIDDFTITSGDVVKKDNFNGGFTQGLFNVTEKDSNNNTVVSLQTTAKTTSNQAAALKVKDLDGNAQDFATNCAYPGGSTISFRAYVPETSSWWGVAYATDLNTIDIYKCAASPYNMTNATKIGEWADYSITLPNDSENYYLAIGGEIGNGSGWGENELLIDDVKITNADGQLIAKDSFSEGFSKGLFDVAGTAVSLVDETETPVSGNKAAAISKVGQGETTPMATKYAYAGGTTITFDARLPESLGSTWWNVAWTTDSDVTNKSIYGGDYQTMSISYKGEWTNYTVTLPDGGPYYVYFTMENSSTNWPDSLLIDNVKIQNASGEIIASDDFNNGFKQGLFQIDSNAVTLVDVEETTVGDTVAFTAYAAPTVNRQVSEADKDKLNSAYAKLSEAGFNKAIALYEGYSEAVGNDIFDTIQQRSVAAEQAAVTVLDIAEKHNIQYYVRDWSFYGLGKNGGTYENTSEIDTETEFERVINTMFSLNNPYIGKAAYAGNFAYDEPTEDQLQHVAWQMKYYNQNVPNGEMYVNLLPHHKKENAGWLGSIIDDNKYKSYLQEYFTNIAPTLGYVSFDHYPLKNDNTLEEMYYNNLQVMAEKCKTTISSDGKPIELRTYVQATGDSTGLRNLNNIADLRFQIYSGMAFGVKEFVYYTYASDTGETDEHYSLFNHYTQEYTWVYDAAKEVNNEVHAIEKDYLDYKWQNVKCVEGSEDSNKSNALFSNVTSASSLTGISSVTGTQDTLVGAFEANSGSNARTNAYMFVNASNPTDNANDTVTVTFDGASAVSVCKNGKQTIVPISSNQYTFTLIPGEGAFIIPLSK